MIGALLTPKEASTIHYQACCGYELSDAGNTEPAFLLKRDIWAAHQVAIQQHRRTLAWVDDQIDRVLEGLPESSDVKLPLFLARLQRALRTPAESPSPSPRPRKANGPDGPLPSSASVADSGSEDPPGAMDPIPWDEEDEALLNGERNALVASRARVVRLEEALSSALKSATHSPDCNTRSRWHAYKPCDCWVSEAAKTLEE